MNRARRPPLQHPLADALDHAVASLGAALNPETIRHYRGAVRSFLTYLGATYPDVGSLTQLRRDPHILGWMALRRSQTPALTTSCYINLLIALRWTFHELAWINELSELAHLIRREDIPRLPYRLPRPLSPEQDQMLQQEFLRRNDLGANVFLLIRQTGMRIGECADLASDCLRSTGPDQWAVHVPLGKLKTERLVPVDPFFRSLERLPDDGFLLPRPRTKEALIRQLRDYLHQVCHEIGLSTRIVPHQFRHTYASEMLRAGVNFPALMNLLGHVDPDMTMRYVDVTLTDLKREFQLARSKPRHLTPQPNPSVAPIRVDHAGVIDALSGAHHVLEMFRRTLPDGPTRRCLDRLSNRLTKIVTAVKSLGPS
jgi:integrase